MPKKLLTNARDPSNRQRASLPPVKAKILVTFTLRTLLSRETKRDVLIPSRH